MSVYRQELSEKYVIALYCVYKLSLELCSMHMCQNHISCHCPETLEGFWAKGSCEPVLFVSLYMIHRLAQFRCGGKAVFQTCL